MNYFSQPKIPREPVKASAPEPKLSGRAPITASPDIVSTFGNGMLIDGNISCPGALQIYGRVTGEIQASHLTVCEGAKVEGKVIAQEAIVQGIFNGTIHANTVKLQGAAKVDGEIFNKSLTIDQNVQFEGVSRRLDRPIDAPKVDQAAKTVAASAPLDLTDPIADVLA